MIKVALFFLLLITWPGINFAQGATGKNNHLDTKEGRIWFRLELEALTEALLSPTTEEQATYLAHALIFRNYRHSVFENSAENENSLELNEGITEYTGLMAGSTSEEESIAQLVYMLENFYKTPSFVNAFPTVTIPIYGFLLSETDPEWNNRINDSTNLTVFFIASFHVVVPNDLKKTADSLSLFYGAESIRAGECLREEKRKSQTTSLKAIFIEQPHLEIGAVKMDFTFDPQGVVPLEELGSVYFTVRITDAWGILSSVKGALVNPQFDKITVSVPMAKEGQKISGDGWTIQLNKNWKMQKDPVTGNFTLVQGP